MSGSFEELKETTEAVHSRIQRNLRLLGLAEHPLSVRTDTRCLDRPCAYRPVNNNCAAVPGLGLANGEAVKLVIADRVRIVWMIDAQGGGFGVQDSNSLTSVW